MGNTRIVSWYDEEGVMQNAERIAERASTIALMLRDGTHPDPEAGQKQLDELLAKLPEEKRAWVLWLP